MKKNYIFLGFLAVLCVLGKLHAQDPHFTQYFASPMTVNPALTGMDVADWRASGIHRSQWWGSYVPPFVTTGISLEKNFTAGRDSKSNLGLGLSMVSDASNAGLLKNNYVSFSGAYHVALDGEGAAMLSGGIMATYASRLLDAGKFAFQDQYGSMGFQRSAPSQDPVSILSNKYWDVQAGLHFRRSFADWGYDLGAAVYHASRPSEGAYNNFSYSVDVRTSLQAGAYKYFDNGNRLHARAITDIQGQHAIYTIGARYGIALTDETIKSFDIGLWHRFGDATCPYVGVTGKSWQAGFSYDVVLSQVRTTYSAVQSMELSLIWQFKAKKVAAPERSVVAYF